ncbi:MAG TPA: right-handed parallel beta-helix repeat-containing protein [Ktedonobacteraceae bacterium]|nr:right-handed parallel beta-helix repeat-containing protein [Ktedonobacteraceae bacterium]
MDQHKKVPQFLVVFFVVPSLLIALILASITVMITGTSPVYAATTAIYVSPGGADSNPGTQSQPIQTLQHAQDLVRSMNQNMSGDITVFLEAGIYRLSQPLSLGPADSGSNGHNVIWQAVSGASPVISGAAKISGWTQFDATKNIWVAQAPTGLKTRQLYVNGTRVQRAHGALPVTLHQTSTGYTASAATMAGWKNPSGMTPQIEFVYAGGLGAWTEPRCPVGSMSGTTITMAQPCWNNSTKRLCCFADGRAYNLVGRMSITEQPTDVQNAFQLLNAAGEWFLDEGSSKIYYIPRSGEDLATADVEAPMLESLVTGTGTASSPVHNIIFDGIQFSYATWLGSNTGDGFSEIQANYQVTGTNGWQVQGLCNLPPTPGTCPYAAWTQIPGNVSFTYDQNIQFTNDAFVHLGAAGLALGNGSQNGLVKGSVFTDISGNGIELGNVNMPTATGSSQTLGNTIADNHVFNLPAEYHGGIGVDIGYAANTTLTHNQIDHTSYTAVSIGWGGWPDKEKKPAQPNFSHDNAISNNLIFNHMQMLNDGGGIYTQGITGSSLANGEHVTGNVIHDQTGKGHVIYTDNGCTDESILGNAIYNTGPANAWASRHVDYTANNGNFDATDVENNYWQNPANYTTGKGVTVANNHVISSPSQIPASIVNNAGLEPAYQGILNWHPAG